MFHPIPQWRSCVPVMAWALFVFVLGPSELGAAGHVVILTPHVDAIRNEFGREFAAWHEQAHGETAQVDWRNVGGTSDALRFLVSEFANKPDGIGVDILFGGGQEPFLVLVDKNLAQAYDPPPDLLAGIPQSVLGMEIYEPGHRWFAAALSSFGILQNTRLQRWLGLPLARRWEDLTQPGLLGWVGAGDPRSSGTMTVMYESFLQARGWEQGWRDLTKIGGNVRTFDRVSSSTAKDVTLGETAYGFAIDFYGFSQVAVAGRTNMAFVLPEDFTAISPDCIALLKGAPNRVIAQHFLDFVLSENGQRLWFLPRGYPGGPRQSSIERMSIRPDFYRRYRDVSNIQFSPFDLKPAFHYDANLARDRRDVLAALVGALLVDSHEELKAAWRCFLRRGSQPKDLAELGRMPLDEAAALALARGPWKTNSALRNLKKIEWQDWARHKYRKLCESPSGT